ncbi:MAG: hypothetical protein GY861_03430 [bacterium]|nr:hypothetical protein [bacterium]
MKNVLQTTTQYIYRNEADARERKNPLFKYSTKIEEIEDGVKIEGVEVKYELIDEPTDEECKHWHTTATSKHLGCTDCKKIFKPTPKTKEIEIEEAVYMALGQASVCWTETPSGVFKSEEANEIGKKLLKTINYLSIQSKKIEHLNLKGPGLVEAIQEIEDKVNEIKDWINAQNR